MADAYVERLMMWGKDPGDVGATTAKERYIGAHSMWMAHLLMWYGDGEGGITVANWKTHISSTAADDAEMDQMVTLVTGAGPQLAQFREVLRQSAIIMAAEERRPGYTTPSEVRDAIGVTNPPNPSS